MKIYHSESKNKDFKVSVDNVEFNEQAMIIEWSGDIGWGKCVLLKNADGKLDIDDEYMGREFVKVLMVDIVDNFSYMWSEDRQK